MPKERTTSIMAIRAEKPLVSQVKERAKQLDMSLNAWLIRAVKQSLRPHKKS